MTDDLEIPLQHMLAHVVGQFIFAQKHPTNALLCQQFGFSRAVGAHHGFDVTMLDPAGVKAGRFGGDLDVVLELPNDVAVPLIRNIAL